MMRMQSTRVTWTNSSLSIITFNGKNSFTVIFLLCVFCFKLIRLRFSVRNTKESDNDDK